MTQAQDIGLALLVIAFVLFAGGIICSFIYGPEPEDYDSY